MSLSNRYIFLKRMYPKHLILINKKDNLTSCKIDKNMWDYFNHSLINLKKYHISYIILDNLNIVEKQNYLDNQFDHYVKIIFLLNLLQQKRKV